MPRLKLKRALVTGSARGVGKAIAEKLAAEGAEVVLTDIQEEVLEATREELAAAGHRCRAYVVDVTDHQAVLDMRERVHDELGSIDILVNNAGVVFGGPFLEVPMARHQVTYRVNVEGVMGMTHAFLPEILESPRGHLVFIASASGFVGLPNGSTYASSKWAVIGFAESIRAELKHTGHKNVGVTTVCPTYINTGMFEGVEPPKTTHLLEPGFIAEKVVEGVIERKVWVREPWIVKVTPFLKHCLPTPVSDFLSDAFGANKSMDQWTGHGPS
ncbi:MAG: SDR family oxidoreductase [Holophagales bacterium]|nr:SDR family oxidoreductase [Holophagales bacterium]